MAGSFLGDAELTPEVQALYDEDLTKDGYVWNASRLWAHRPEAWDQLFALMDTAFKPTGLTVRQRGILVLAAVSTMGDSYCSMAWGKKLSGWEDPALATAVLTGTDDGLSEQEQAMARWARQVARDPNAVTPADTAALRDTGLSDSQIFGITLFVALRLAFSTVNDALGAQPDPQLAAALPAGVAAAVTYGRPVSA